MSFDPNPLPEGWKDPEDKTSPIQGLELELKPGGFGIFTARFTYGWRFGKLLHRTQKVSHDFWHKDLLGIQSGQIDSLSVDHDREVIVWTKGGERHVTEGWPRRVWDARLRDVIPGSNLLLTGVEKKDHDPKKVFRKASATPTLTRRHMLVLADIPEGVENLFVVHFARLGIEGKHRPQDYYEDAVVINPKDLTQVRRGLLFV